MLSVVLLNVMAPCQTDGTTFMSNNLVETSRPLNCPTFKLCWGESRNASRRRRRWRRRRRTDSSTFVRSTWPTCWRSTCCRNRRGSRGGKFCRRSFKTFSFFASPLTQSKLERLPLSKSVRPEICPIFERSGQKCQTIYNRTWFESPKHTTHLKTFKTACLGENWLRKKYP